MWQSSTQLTCARFQRYAQGDGRQAEPVPRHQRVQPARCRALRGSSAVRRPHYLRVYMGNLRHKLEDDSAQPRHIVTETGVGYRLLTD